ncbi:hypothetical protein ACFQ4K_27005 [Tistrella bauzanensis]
MRRSILAAVLAAGTMLATPLAAMAETLQDALVASYVTNPRIDAARAQLRAVDENVPTALAGRRPQAQVQGSAGRAGTSAGTARLTARIPDPSPSRSRSRCGPVAGSMLSSVRPRHR